MVAAAAGLGFGLAAFSYAQDKDPPRKAPDKADKSIEKSAAPTPVIEITRSSQVNCDVKPVMTDEEIARCKKAWRK
jgi:hypothetical protein